MRLVSFGSKTCSCYIVVNIDSVVRCERAAGMTNVLFCAFDVLFLVLDIVNLIC